MDEELVKDVRLVCELAEHSIVVESSTLTKSGSEPTQTTARILLFGTSCRAQRPQRRVGDVTGQPNVRPRRGRPVGERAAVGQRHLLRICRDNRWGQSPRFVGR